MTGYHVERCAGAGCSNFAQVATSSGTGTAFKDTTVSASTSYSYRVRAFDAAGNQSVYSNTASASTPAAPDTTPPSQPGTLSATAVSNGEVDLSWGASTDNVGVTGYHVERCAGAGCSNFVQVATSSGTGTAFKDTTVSASTSYSYRVRAFDAAGNQSVYSNTASASTPAAPSGLVAAYGFDEGSGTTVTDAFGNGNTGTISGATWSTAGKYGDALNSTAPFGGHDPQQRVTATVERDDAGGLGRPVDGRRELARRAVQGQRRLLPGGDLEQWVVSGCRL